VSVHEPVLTREVVDYLAPGRGGVFVDCTVGLGGHARAMLDGGATRLIGLDRDEAAEVHRLASSALEALAGTMSPQGFNVGWNLGRIAGAGVVDHVHLHVVPRWAGDTNFMPVLADVKVLPEALEETRRKIAAAWP